MAKASRLSRNAAGGGKPSRSASAFTSRRTSTDAELMTGHRAPIARLAGDWRAEAQLAAPGRLGWEAPGAHDAILRQRVGPWVALAVDVPEADGARPLQPFRPVGVLFAGVARVCPVAFGERDDEARETSLELRLPRQLPPQPLPAVDQRSHVCVDVVRDRSAHLLGVGRGPLVGPDVAQLGDRRADWPVVANVMKAARAREQSARLRPDRGRCRAPTGVAWRGRSDRELSAASPRRRSTSCRGPDPGSSAPTRRLLRRPGSWPSSRSPRRRFRRRCGAPRCAGCRPLCRSGPWHRRSAPGAVRSSGADGRCLRSSASSSARAADKGR